MEQDKKDWKKVGSFYYSQFIEVDINPQDKPERFVRACLIEDFNKWVEEKKQIGILPIDYVRVHSAILPMLKEYIKEIYGVNICGWKIGNNLVKSNEMLIRTKTKEFIVPIKIK